MQLYINILRPYLDQIFDEKYVPHFYFAFHLMAMSNSCINPFIYAVMSSKFRAGYLHYWHCLITCCGYIKQTKNINESIVLTASFRHTKRGYKTSITVNEHIDLDHGSTMSVPSTIPLISSN